MDGIVSNYDKTRILPLNPPPKGDNKNTPPSPLERGAEEVFEIDVTSLAAKLGRNIARLIAKGIVQDHYDGDWSRVRFIGLGEEINKTRVVSNISLYKTFLKGKITVQCKAYDIFHQLTNFDNGFYEQELTEATYNCIPRYGMISIGYRFGKK